jgi:acyl-CoA synthetase (AMP-forming)/AMP-acid ligase II
VPSSSEFSTLVGLLRWRGLRQPDQCAYTFLTDRGTEAGHVTYAELDRRARAVAAVLQRLSVPGEPALLL